MSDFSIWNKDLDAGEPGAAARLWPLVYDELRRLAAAQMARETPGHTLDATALVHEAYLRLVGPDPGAEWSGRSGFFRAAAEAMRRILVDHARAKKADKRGGHRKRFELTEADRISLPDPETVLAIDEALTSLALTDPAAADLARLRLFAGLSVEEAGTSLGSPRASAYRDWAYARAFLSNALAGERNFQIS